LAHPMSPEHELAMLATVDSMMEGYHDLRTLMVTPFPAPLANLIRGLAIGYASLLPLLAVWERNGDSNDYGNRDSHSDHDADLGAHLQWHLLWNLLWNVDWQWHWHWHWLLPACALVGLATLAIAGLLMVSDDLDDPFGHGGLWDASGIAEYCAEEIVRAILESDGPEWAGVLRYRTHRKASEPIRPTLDFDFCGSERSGGGKNRNKSKNKNKTLGNSNDDHEAATETDRLLPGGSEDSTMGEESKEHSDNPFDDEFVSNDDNEWHEDDSIYFRSRAAMPEWMVER